MDDLPKKLPVYFVNIGASIRTITPGNLLIRISNDNWNDFGHRTLFEFYVVNSVGDENWRKFRLSFLTAHDNNLNDIEIASEVFKRGASDILASDNFPHYFSLQMSPRSYRDLAEEFGVPNAKKILSSLGDIVVAKNNKQQPEWLEKALNSDAFHKSFLRTTDGFLAYFDGNNALLNKSNDAESRIPRKLILTFKLDCFVNHHAFVFKFDPDNVLPKRITAIVGQNGVGKSRTLNELVQSLLNSNLNLSDEDGYSPKILKVIAICTPGETVSTFPPSNPDHKSISYTRLSASPGRDGSESSEALPIVLQNLAKIDGLDNGYRWFIFERAINTFMDFSKIAILPSTENYIDKDKVSEDAVLISHLTHGGETHRLETSKRIDRNGVLVRWGGDRFLPLSSGQISFFRLAAQLCLNIRKGTLVLIDEPETHLHPRLVTELVSMLNEILDVTESIAIVATHSAYLVREIPTSQVYVIKADDYDAVHIGTPRIKTFGADVGAISDFIFEDDASSILLKGLAGKLREKKLTINDVAKELSNEAIMFLKREQKNGESGR